MQEKKYLLKKKPLEIIRHPSLIIYKIEFQKHDKDYDFNNSEKWRLMISFTSTGGSQRVSNCIFKLLITFYRRHKKRNEITGTIKSNYSFLKNSN